MAPIDRFLKENRVPSARYVDDLYIFVTSVGEADEVLRALIPELRSYDLSLNESKSRIMSKNLLLTMEPDLEALFEKAVEEISSQMEDETSKLTTVFSRSGMKKRMTMRKVRITRMRTRR